MDTTSIQPVCMVGDGLRWWFHLTSGYASRKVANAGRGRLWQIPPSFQPGGFPVQ
ncbi:MAG: hypothetical protein H6672_21915 [Anaerolineaceae bacterium]|nr:hypothetical protein [Anaerolineaceae bacterium]